MLHQISWFTYAVSTISLAFIYYLYVGLTFYRTELQAVIRRLTGKQPVLKAQTNSDLLIPDYDIMGKAASGDIDFLSQEELLFAPADDQNDAFKEDIIPAETNVRLIGSFSEMVSEVKTLIRVINESSESKENFEMLFRLIIQKYPALADTTFQQQINDYLLSEGADEFPFSLTQTDLNNYWTNKD